MKLANWHGVQRGNWNGATPFWEKRRRGYGGGYGGYDDDPEGYYTQREAAPSQEQSPLQDYITQEMLRLSREQQAAQGTPEAAAAPAAASPRSKAVDTVQDVAEFTGAPGTGVRGLAKIPGEIADVGTNLSEGNYGTAALGAAGVAARGGMAYGDVSRGVKAIGDTRAASQLPGAATGVKAVGEAVSRSALKAPAAPGMAADAATRAATWASKYVPSAAKALPAIATGSKVMGQTVGRAIPVLGSAASTLGNIQGAITGDQGYLSDSAGGQFAEQALRSAGDVAGIFANPVAGAINTASQVANAGVNAWRAGADLNAARESGNAADAAEKRLKDFQAARKAPGGEKLKFTDWKKQQADGQAAPAPAVRPPVTPSTAAPPAGTAAAKPAPAIPGAPVASGNPKPQLHGDASGATNAVT